jgi:hypothetical protein
VADSNKRAHARRRGKEGREWEHSTQHAGMRPLRSRHRRCRPLGRSGQVPRPKALKPCTASVGARVGRVRRTLFFASLSAPRSSSSVTTDVWPPSAAHCSGVQPICARPTQHIMAQHTGCGRVSAVRRRSGRNDTTLRRSGRDGATADGAPRIAQSAHGVCGGAPRPPARAAAAAMSETLPRHGRAARRGHSGVAAAQPAAQRCAEPHIPN